VLGSARAPRAGFGALAETNLAGWGVPTGLGEKVRDDEGVIASTRGRVRSPKCELAPNRYYTSDGYSPLG
jgi:hypothetical protein